MSETFNPVVRVGVDWDKDHFINWVAEVGDPLNLIPTTPHLYNVPMLNRGLGLPDRLPDSDYGVSWSHVSDASEPIWNNGQSAEIIHLFSSTTREDKIALKYIPEVNQTINQIIIPLLNPSNTSVGGNNVILTIETHDGINDRPSGTAITNGTVSVAESTIANIALFTTPQDYTFTFSVAPSVTAGTTYWVVITVDYGGANAKGLDTAGAEETADLVKTRLDGSWQTEVKGLSVTLVGVQADPYISVGKNHAGDITTIAVDISTEYTAGVWVKRTAGATDQNLKLLVYDDADTLLDTSNNVLLSGTDWLLVSVTFTTGGSSAYVYFKLARDGTPASSIEFKSAGWIMVAGATLARFNLGTVQSTYDNVTDFTLSFSTKSGRNNPISVMPSEGKADITLDNLTRVFSPEYSGSIITGGKVSGQRIVFQVQNPLTDAWVTIWSGLTDSITPETKANGNTNAVLSCLQGLFKLSDATLSVSIDPSVTYRIDELLQLIAKRGWITSNQVGAYASASRTETAFINSEAGSFVTEPADTNLTDVGEEWSTSDTSPLSAMTELLNIERGWLWIDRDSILQFRNRHYYDDNRTPDITLTVDTDFQDATYTFAKYLYNNVTVTYYPKEQVDYTFWKTRPYIKVAGRDPLTGEYGKKTVNVRFELEEGATLVSAAVNAFDAESNPSTYEAFYADNVTNVTSLVEVTFKMKGQSEASITIRNRSNGQAKVYITLKGSATISYGGQVIEVTDEESTADHYLRAFSNQSLKQVIEEEIADDLANYLIFLYSTPCGNFDRLVLKSRDEDWLVNMLTTKIGTHVLVSDYQVGGENVNTVVIAEDWTFMPGILSATYTTQRIGWPDFVWKLGISQLGTDTYGGF